VTDNIIVGKEFTFDAAHILRWHEGKCSRMHGHTYLVRIEFEGPLNENGIVVDFGHIKQFIITPLTDFLDHKVLNELGEDVLSNPTAENITRFIIKAILDELNRWPEKFKNVKLHQVIVWETPTSWARKEVNKK